MTDSSTGIAGKIDDSLLNIINAVLDCRISAVTSILKEEGIPEISIADRSEDDAIAEASYTPPSLPAPSRPVSSGSSTDEATNYATPFTDFVDYRVVPSSRSTRTDSSQRYSSIAPPDDLSYTRLLDKVILIARSATFPEFGSSDMKVRIDGLPEGSDIFDGARTSYGSSIWEHRNMIGAAGELLVSNVMFIFTYSRSD
jgi:hypothetical protein